MKILVRACSIFLLILCSGCIAFPYHFTDRPGAKGVIVDGHSETPLANARVDLSSVWGLWNETNNTAVWQTNLLVSTYSTTNGMFKIPPKREWGLLIIPGDYFTRQFALTIG